MANEIKEIIVPDIGDFSDVPIIDIFMKVGDTVAEEQALITLESDKATMDVPSPFAGTITEVCVAMGDKVSQGTLLARIDSAANGATAGKEVKDAANTAAPAPTAAAASAASTSSAAPAVAGAYSGKVDLICDVLVLGAGPGGYSAAFRAADLGMSTVLVERYETLGGVCLNVGCIPSKALLHIAGVLTEVKSLQQHGVEFAAPRIDMDGLRHWKNSVVSRLTTGLAGMAKARKVNTVRGVGQFISPNHLQVTDAQGEQKVVQFSRAIIAAGSSAVKLPFMPDDPRIIDSTGALALQTIPPRLLVIGGGIIGLEMATVYQALGSTVTVVELSDGLMPGADRDLVKVWEKFNKATFAATLLSTGVTAATASASGINVTFSTGTSAEFDQVLVAVGRTPNGKKLAADQAGVAVTDRGFINVDAQMRTNMRHIFAIGDIVGQPMLAHKAVHEAHVAAEVCAGEIKGDEALARAAFDVVQIPSVAYTNPEIAWAGQTETMCKAAGVEYKQAVFPWAASGRAIANGRDEGFTKLLFDAQSHRLIGGGIVGTNAGDLIGEICLGIEMGADAVDIGKTIHPHPTLCESIGMAAEVAHGSCTDLPPSRKK